MPAQAQLRLITCSPRLPGQLTWPAWQALMAGQVHTQDDANPHLPHLRAAGAWVTVEPRRGVEQRRRDLLDRAARGPMVWFAPEPALVEAMAGCDVVQLVAGSVEPPGAALLDAVAVMDRLRSPGGCPWDAAQTHRSLMPYLLEEAYEAYEALEDDDGNHLRDELGDVLLQILFHARLAEEGERPWSVDDVASGLVDKLTRRHPHVFAGAPADDLAGTWESLKAAEGRTSVTDGVPLGQPALMLAAKLQRRAGRLGAPVGAGEGIGGQLWLLVQRALQEGVDPEAALRTTARAFRDRLAAAEAVLREQGTDPTQATPERWADLLG